MDEAVKYELEMSRPEANMFSINPDSGDISAKSNFDPNLLSDAKLITLNLKVQNQRNPQSPTGYRKRTAQILRATHFYDLLM